jgi:streptogramin lyase
MQQKITLTPSFSALLMRLFLLTLVVLLASCGGGGGGDDRSSTKSFVSLGVFAGNPYGPGSTDGTGAAARFNSPYGVATDTSGNVYVAESFNHTIRKITPAGVVTTLAGAAGMPGSADGTGSAARFRIPAAVATDASGTVYVVDSGSHTIRKITPAGVVTTLAGTAGVSGSTDGTGSAASFYYPARVATDASGNVYVADSGNNTIRKITPAGVVTTLAGTAGASGSADGTGPEARLNSPTGVATDVSGNVYVADYGNNTIRKITPAGVVTTLAGTAGTRGSNDGTGAESRFSNPDGVATDASGNVYVTDSSNNTIRKISPAGVVTTLAGTAGTRGSNDGTGAEASFNGSRGVATDASGNVYVADSFNSAIRKITPAGVVTTLAGTPGVEGSVDGTGAAARFSGPRGVTLDASGNIYVADRTNQTIRKITPAGVVTTLAGTAGSLGIDDGTGAAARFAFPYGVATDAGGNVYVTDSLNYTIRKITPAGVVTTLAGTARASGSEDGTGGVARFNNPTGLATDASGNVYVADYNNHTIRKITPAGVVTTLAGTAGVSGGEDGAGAAARFSSPAGLATDASGNVYVADFGNHTIRKITPAGVVTTLAGKASTRGNDNGNGAAARFNSPRGVATDASGAVYVADTYNYTIRKITPAGEVSTLAGTAGLNGFQPGALPGGLFEPSAMAVSDSRIYFSTSNGIAFID